MQMRIQDHWACPNQLLISNKIIYIAQPQMEQLKPTYMSQFVDLWDFFVKYGYTMFLLGTIIKSPPSQNTQFQNPQLN